MKTATKKDGKLDFSCAWKCPLEFDGVLVVIVTCITQSPPCLFRGQGVVRFPQTLKQPAQYTLSLCDVADTRKERLTLQADDICGALTIWFTHLKSGKCLPAVLTSCSKTRGDFKKIKSNWYSNCRLTHGFPWTWAFAPLDLYLPSPICLSFSSQYLLLQ